jgi:hypothetical protein
MGIHQFRSVGVALVRVPGWLLRVVGTVVHLYNDRLFVRDSWAVHIVVCTENLIRIDGMKESLKLARC